MRREEGGVHQHDAVRGSWRKAPAPRWTGMPTVFPNLYRFNNPDLGFMGA